MTYTQARMIIMNPESYIYADVRRAAVFILGTLGASQEDIDTATYLL